jgi:hypothetical protein
MRRVDGVHEIITRLIHHSLDVSTQEETSKVIFEVVVQESPLGTGFCVSTDK